MTDRFWAKVDVRGPDECWPWLGVITRGYGQVTFNGHSRRAHRVAYELLTGSPPGPVMDHLCHSAAVRDGGCDGGEGCLHRRCCNPAHLEDVDQRSNVHRGLAPTAVNAAKTHCVHGHPFSDENVYTTPDGERVCLTCRRETGRRYEAKRKTDPERMERLNERRRARYRLKKMESA